MKSIKPGRGPSMMGGIGAVIAIVFGIVRTLSAAQMGAPGFFPLFGVLFILAGVVQAAYHFKNAGSKNRFSAFDITEEGEEPDPLNERIGAEKERTETVSGAGASGYCPYCGAAVEKDFAYCGKCGKKLPR